MAEPQHFKFHELDGNGKQKTLFRKKGTVDDERVVLDKESFPISGVRGAFRKLDRLIVVADGPGGPTAEPIARVMQLDQGTLRKVVPAINVRTSRVQCQKRRETLERAGRRVEYREAMCPGCKCTIDLSRHPTSPETYCTFCDTVWTIPEADAQRRREEPFYRCCGVCGLYAKPSEFTTLYFYFLLVVYGWSLRRQEMCNTCMRKEAWKMVGVNLIGLLGEVVAVPQLIRAYAGGSAMSKTFAGLDSANALLKGGKLEKALPVYEQMLTRLGHAAGVRYNHGMACVQQRRFEQAALCFAQALEDCSNYAPAADALGGCYQQLGLSAELQALKQEWNDGAGAELAATDASQTATQA